MSTEVINYYSIIPASRGIGLYNVVSYDFCGTMQIVEPELPIHEALNLVNNYRPC